MRGRWISSERRAIDQLSRSHPKRSSRGCDRLNILRLPEPLNQFPPLGSSSQIPLSNIMLGLVAALAALCNLRINTCLVSEFAFAPQGDMFIAAHSTVLSAAGESQTLMRASLQFRNFAISQFRNFPAVICHSCSPANTSNHRTQT
jgi:hypothetical protein